MSRAGGRIGFAEMDRGVRTWVERLLGSPVVEAISQPGGFSPGVAARLVLADGRRAFLKAVSANVNVESVDLHRREGEVMATMPASPWVPAFVDRYDDGEWVGLLFEDIDGRPPAIPWREEEIGLVLEALAAMHTSFTPAPLDVPTVSDHYREAFSGWRRLAAGEAAPLDEWSQRHLPRLADVEAGWEEAAIGDTLLHGDLRADNILLTDGGVSFVDWPWACVGPPWLDVVAFAPSVSMQGGPDPEWVLARVGDVPDDALTAVVTAVAGYFTRQAAQPDPPGLPTLRVFQAAQGAAARAWLRDRLGWQ